MMGGNTKNWALPLTFDYLIIFWKIWKKLFKILYNCVLHVLETIYLTRGCYYLYRGLAFRIVLFYFPLEAAFFSNGI